MEIGEKLLLLGRLEAHVRGDHPLHAIVDIKPIAEEFGLDLDEIMPEIIHICETRNYRVGFHMYCTRKNVIPDYDKNGELKLDADHVEGLARILAVHHGIGSDY